MKIKQKSFKNENIIGVRGGVGERVGRGGKRGSGDGGFGLVK